MLVCIDAAEGFRDIPQFDVYVFCLVHSVSLNNGKAQGRVFLPWAKSFEVRNYLLSGVEVGDAVDPKIEVRGGTEFAFGEVGDAAFGFDDFGVFGVVFVEVDICLVRCEVFAIDGELGAIEDLEGTTAVGSGDLLA
ncbi:MAG: hypothetical protein VZR77_03515, partial [Candidatus Enteromonas sp.]|nr:hypothetical protein [Candidatus Enteromonas sp.]